MVKSVRIFHTGQQLQWYLNRSYFELLPLLLTDLGCVMHMYMSKLTSNGSDNGLSPGRRQAIIRTNAGILDPWEQTSVKS